MAETNRIATVLATIAANPPYLARLTARFWCKVAKSEKGCWEWTSAKFPSGYGAFSIPGVGGLKANRVAYWLVTGEWPEGIGVCHHCDNPGCVRPDHLFLGTPLDNMRDSVRKGRRFYQTNPDAFRAIMRRASLKTRAARRAIRLA